MQDNQRALDAYRQYLQAVPNADNREAIELFGGVPVVAELPRVEPLALAALQDDPAFRIDDSLLRDLLAAADA